MEMLRNIAESRMTQMTALGLGILMMSGCADGDRDPVEHTPTPIPTVSQEVAPNPGDSGQGYDVSWPQCDDVKRGSLPESHDSFVIAGVNGRLPTEFNPCLGDLVKWAKASRGVKNKHGMPGVSFYVTAANPINEIVPTWPKSGNTPKGKCTPKNQRSEACAYQYGMNRATGDIKAMTPYLGDILKKERKVWIDVEPEYSWDEEVDGRRHNRSMLRGMIETFRAEGVDVGIYSRAEVWERLMDRPSSRGYDLPNDMDAWMMGARDWSQAKENCNMVNFTTGKKRGVRVAQIPGDYTMSHLDENVSCP